MKERWVAEKIPYAYLLPKNEGVVRLGGGGTLVSYDIHGLGHETSSGDQVLTACEHFAGSFSQFQTGDFLHVIIHRTKAPQYERRSCGNRAAQMINEERARQFEAGCYYRNYARCYIGNEDEHPVSNYFKALLFGSAEHRMRGSRALQMQRFFHRLHKWEDAIGPTLKPRRLNSHELFADLVLCVNGTDYKPPLPPPGTPLRHVIGQQDWHGGSFPKIGEFYLRPVTLVWPWPEQTTAQALATLLTHPGELMISCRFVCLDQLDALAMAKLERKHYIRETFGTGLKQFFINAFHVESRKTGEDEDIEEQIKEIDATISAIQKGMPYGWASITITPRGTDGEEVYSRARQIQKDLAALDPPHGSRIEDAAAIDVIEGSLPGQGTGNVRRPLISAINFTELALPVEHWSGTPYIDSTFFPKDTPVPLQIVGSGNEPFYVPVAIRSAGHTVIIGPTTAGKSTLLRAIEAAYSAIAGIRIRVIDYGYSSFVLTHAMGGRYIELATDNSSPLCPFQTIEADGGTTFLFDWCSRLLERWQIELNERQAADLTRAIELARDHGIRTMTGLVHLIHEPAVRGVLRNYCQGQQWGHIFDGEPANDSDPELCTYELYHLDLLGERALGPAFELIIREIEVGLSAERPTMVVNDEVSKQLAYPVARRHLAHALRTFRKFNAWIVMATQSLQEIKSTEIRALLLESTAIKVFLPNRAALGPQVAQLYEGLGLGPKELEMIAQHMVPQQDYLWVTEYGSRVGRLDLGPIGKALCASTGSDSVAKARALLAEYGPEQFLEAWLWAYGLGPEPKAAESSLSSRRLSLEKVAQSTIPSYTNGRLTHAAS